MRIEPKFIRFTYPNGSVIEKKDGGFEVVTFIIFKVIWFMLSYLTRNIFPYITR